MGWKNGDDDDNKKGDELSSFASREYTEESCKKALRERLLSYKTCTSECISDSSFSRFTFDLMVAWQSSSPNHHAHGGDNSHLESVCKEKEDEKSPLKVTPSHEDVSLFYSDLMPLLVDHGPGVKEDAFAWFASLLPLAGDVTNSRFTFETLTAPTANLLYYPAYDKFLKEIDKCIKHLQKQETPKGVQFSDDEFILHVEGTPNSQRVVRHIGGQSWPGRLTLTNYALYFEASGSVTYEDALKIALSKNKEQSVKPAATGPWGAPIFDKAMMYTSSEMTEGVVLEFPEAASSTRRDHWLALTKEIILLHEYISKHESLSASQTWEMHARTTLGIIRLHAAREMLRMAPPLPRSFLIFTLFEELPKGDYVLEELEGILKQTDTSCICSGTALLRMLNTPHNIEADLELKEPVVVEKDGLSTLNDAVDVVREEAKGIEKAKATTEVLKQEGVTDSAVVFVELLKPLLGIWVWLQQVLTWKKPGVTVIMVSAILLIAYKEWIGKALAIGLLWLAFEMIQARRLRIKDKYDKVVVCTASDQTALESIVTAQHSLNTAHDLVQQVNIAILKIYSILVSKAPKQTNVVIMLITGIALLLLIVPFKYIVMATTIYGFAMTSNITSKANKNATANDSGNRRLKEWWDSIPIIPVHVTDDPEARRQNE